MYNMNMVVMDTITKIQLLTRKCKESNFEYVFCNLENNEQKKKEKRGSQKEANNIPSHSVLKNIRF